MTQSQNRHRRGRGGLFGTGGNVPTLTKIALQPTGVPHVPHVQPQRYETGRNLTKLAQSLSSLNAGLNALAGVQAQEQAVKESQDDSLWIAKRQQMSLEQLRKEALGNTPDGNRARQDALNVLLAEKTSAAFRRRVGEFYHTEFDKTAGNWDEDYARLEQEFAASLGENDLAKGAFFELNKGFREQMFAADQTQKIEYTKQQIGTAVTDSFRNAIEDATMSGKSPQEAAQFVFAKAAVHGDFMSMSPQERDETLFQIAQEYAIQGREDIVRALLEGNRGELGQPLIKSHANQALKLINQAAAQTTQEKAHKDWQELYAFHTLVQNGELTPEHAARFEQSRQVTAEKFAAGLTQSDNNREHLLALQAKEDAKREAKETYEREWTNLHWQVYEALERVGGIKDIEDSYIPNEQGAGVVRVSKSEIIANIVERKEAEWAQWIEDSIEQGGDEAQIRDQANQMRFKWYGSNNIPNEKWANQLSGIAARITTMDFSKEGDELVEHGRQVAKLYRDLKAANPAYLDTLIKDKNAREFLEYQADAMQEEGMSEKAALLAASQHIGLGDEEKLKRRVNAQEAQEIVENLASQFGLDERSHVLLEGHVQRLAQRGGADKATIVNKLTRDFERTMLVYHGVPIFNHRELPTDFLPLIDEVVSERFKQYGEEYGLPDVDDLYVEKDASGSHFVVKSKSLGGMVVGAEPINGETLAAARKQVEQRRVDTFKQRLEARRHDQKMNKDADYHYRHALTNELNQIQAEMALARGTWRVQVLQEKVNSLTDELLSLEAHDLIAKGHDPNSREWRDWKAQHGRDVDYLEKIWRGKQPSQ